MHPPFSALPPAPRVAHRVGEFPEQVQSHDGEDQRTELEHGRRDEARDVSRRGQIRPNIGSAASIISHVSGRACVEGELTRRMRGWPDHCQTFPADPRVGHSLHDPDGVCPFLRGPRDRIG